MENEAAGAGRGTRGSGFAPRGSSGVRFILVGELRRAAGWMRYSDFMRSQNSLRRANTTARSKMPYSDSSLRCFLSYVPRLGQGSERGCPAAAVCLAGTSQLAVEDTIRCPGRSCIHRHGLHTPDTMTSEYFPISTAATPIPIMTSDYPGKTTAIAVAMPQENQTIGNPSMRAFHSVRCWDKLR
jgi:hypothetical protein